MTDMTPADIRTSACEGKQKLTRAVAEKIIKRDKHFDRAREAYHCQHCRAWHVGSPTGFKRCKAPIRRAK